MTERGFTADIGPADEDGYSVVIVSDPDGFEFGRHSIRYDQVRQWTEQELGILNDQERLEAFKNG